MLSDYTKNTLQPQIRWDEKKLQQLLSKPGPVFFWCRLLLQPFHQLRILSLGRHPRWGFSFDGRTSWEHRPVQKGTMSTHWPLFHDQPQGGGKGKSLTSWSKLRSRSNGKCRISSTIFPSSSPNLYDLVDCVISVSQPFGANEVPTIKKVIISSAEIDAKNAQGLTTSISQKVTCCTGNNWKCTKKSKMPIAYVQHIQNHTVITWHKPTQHTCWVGIAWKLGHHFSQVSSLNCFPEVASPRISTLKGRHASRRIMWKPWNPKVLRLRPEQFRC